MKSEIKYKSKFQIGNIFKSLIRNFSIYNFLIIIYYYKKSIKSIFDENFSKDCRNFHYERS